MIPYCIALPILKRETYNDTTRGCPGRWFRRTRAQRDIIEALADRLDLTLIDKSDSFVFGFSKLDVMFGRKTPDAVRLAYRNIAKPGVRFRQEAITAIDPVARRVTTDGGTYDADVLVVALGADYDPGATPGSPKAATSSIQLPAPSAYGRCCHLLERPRDCRRDLSTVQCPPARARPRCCCTTISPGAVCATPAKSASSCRSASRFLRRPRPPGVARRLRRAGYHLRPNRLVRALDPARCVAILDDASEMPYDLFLGIPKHRVPDVVAASGMTENGWIPVNPKNLSTRFPACMRSAT